MNGDCQTLPLYQGSGWPFVLLSTAAPPQAPGLPIYRRYRTLLFFLNVIADTNEYDLTRIETLKILGLRDYVPEDHATVGRAIMHLLDDRDDGVRNYATITMREFMQVDGAPEAISKVLLDPDENITIRSSALGSLHRSGPDDCTSIFALFVCPLHVGFMCAVEPLHAVRRAAST